MRYFAALWEAPKQIENDTDKGAGYVETRPMVFEAESTPVYTGLLDAAGHEIYKAAEPKPIGFIKFETDRS